MADNPAAGGGGGAAAPDHVHKPYCDGYCKNTGRTACDSDCFTCGTCEKVVCEDCGGLEDGICAPCLANLSSQETSQESTVPESSQESEPEDEVLTFKDLLKRELKMTKQEWQDSARFTSADEFKRATGAYGLEMTAFGSKRSRFRHYVPASALTDVPVPIFYLDRAQLLQISAVANDVAGVTAMLGHEGFMEALGTMGINQALISAAQEGHVDIVRLLLPRADDHFRHERASFRGYIGLALTSLPNPRNPVMVELLFSRADQRRLNDELINAVRDEDGAMIDFLLPRADQEGLNRAFFTATTMRNLSMMEMLVARGADVTVRNNRLVYLFSDREREEYEPIFNFLVAHGANLEDGIAHHAVQEEDEDDGGLSSALQASLTMEAPAPPRVPRNILVRTGDGDNILKGKVLLLGMSKDNTTDVEREDADDQACTLCTMTKSEVPLSPFSKVRKAFVVTKCGHVFCRPCIVKWVEGGEGSSHLCPNCRSVIAEDMPAAAPSAAVGGGGGGAAAAATCCSGGDVRAMCFTHRPHQPSPADISRILACPHTPWAAAWWLENDDADICDRALRGDFTSLDTVLGGHLTPALKEAIKGEFCVENFGTMVHPCHTCGEEGCNDNGWRLAEHGDVVNEWFCESCFPKCITCQSEEVVEHPEADKWYCEAHKMREDPPGSGCFRVGL